MSKICFIDTETTGLDANRNFVHQIAGEIWVNNAKVEEFDYKVRPPLGAIINSKALEVSGTTMDMLRDYPLHTDVHAEFTKLLGVHVDKFDPKDKYFFAAYNAGFDERFMRSFFTACNDNYYGSWFYNGVIDVMALAANHLKEERHKMANFKLVTVAGWMGILQDSAHQASADVYMMTQIYKKINKL